MNLLDGVHAILAFQTDEIIAKLSLKVHKNENFFGSDFEFCVISLLVMLKY